MVYAASYIPSSSLPILLCILASVPAELHSCPGDMQATAFCQRCSGVCDALNQWVDSMYA